MGEGLLFGEGEAFSWGGVGCREPRPIPRLGATFRKESVDGAVLFSLSEGELRQSYGLTEAHARLLQGELKVLGQTPPLSGASPPV